MLEKENIQRHIQHIIMVVISNKDSIFDLKLFDVVLVQLCIVLGGTENERVTDLYGQSVNEFYRL